MIANRAAISAFRNPRDRSPDSVQRALHNLWNERARRRFGGRRSALRCERAGPDLLYLIFDGDDDAAFDLAVVVAQIAKSLKVWARVDKIESRDETGRDVFAVRERVYSRETN